MAEKKWEPPEPKYSVITSILVLMTVDEFKCSKQKARVMLAESLRSKAVLSVLLQDMEHRKNIKELESQKTKQRSKPARGRGGEL